MSAAKLSGKGDIERELRGLVIDSRLVEPDFAFAAIPGERVDGHDYVAKAFELGAACCIVERDIPDAQGCLIVVDSTAKAMGTARRGIQKDTRHTCCRNNRLCRKDYGKGNDLIGFVAAI